MVNREQQLVDMMFEIALSTNYIKDMTVEEIVEWVTRQLKGCGFKGQPVGCSWYYLTDE